MTPERQNIAIAEFCGWTRISSNPHLYGGVLYGHRESPFRMGPIPKYTSDLNAIHEAEMKLSDEQHATFQSTLQRIIRRTVLMNDSRWLSGTDPVERDYLSAIADIRAESLLRAISKWEES